MKKLSDTDLNRVSGGTGTGAKNAVRMCLNCGEDNASKLEVQGDPDENGKITVICGSCGHKFTIDADGVYGSV